MCKVSGGELGQDKLSNRAVCDYRYRCLHSHRVSFRSDVAVHDCYLGTLFRSPVSHDRCGLDVTRVTAAYRASVLVATAPAGMVATTMMLCLWLEA